MAKEDKNTTKPSGRSSVSKKTQTVRERREAQASNKPKRIRGAAGKIKTPLEKTKKLSSKEVHVIPLPDNKVGRFLGKKGRLSPKFLREAFAEVKLVTWPDRKNTVKLTLAVFIFAIIFAGIVGLLDWGLGELFKKFVVERT